MQSKEDIYAEQIHPIVVRLADLCQKYEFPMLTAVCLDRREVDGQAEVHMAGGTNLHSAEDVPSIMMIAATVLQLPGFETNDENEFIEVH
jgi:hypothetical protein